MLQFKVSLWYFSKRNFIRNRKFNLRELTLKNFEVQKLNFMFGMIN